MNSVYGPVPSWRLGRSLGIDAICREKTCSFDCIYCQLGSTKHKTSKRKEFVGKEELETELKKALKRVKADIVTFSGTGEPTLASNLMELIETVKENTELPVAILTNSSLFNSSEVRKALKEFDLIVAKLDASNEETFKEVNRPLEGITFRDTLKGIKKIRKEFKEGRFALQSMFVEKNKGNAKEIAEIAREIQPDEIQIDTPLRPCGVKPLSRKEIQGIKKEFKGMNAVTVYEKKKPIVKVLDLKETRIRRPEL